MFQLEDKNPDLCNFLYTEFLKHQVVLVNILQQCQFKNNIDFQITNELFRFSSTFLLNLFFLYDNA